MIVSALVSIIIAVVIFLLVILPGGKKIEAAFFGGNSETLETFVNGINSVVPEKTEDFVLQLNENSAVIGFSKDAAAYKCFKCVEGMQESITPKPDNPECNGKACVCFCDKEFEANGPGLSGSHWNGKCNKPFTCKELNSQINIADKTVIGKTGGSLTGSDKYWEKSFMFGRNVESQMTGSQFINKEETIVLHVQRKGDIIGVCDSYALKYNGGKCIT